MNPCRTTIDALSIRVLIMTRSRLLAALAAPVLALSLAGCGLLSPDEQAEADGGGGIVVTHFAPSTELFVEYRPLVQGKDRRFDAHLTWLDSYKPVTDGTLTAELVWPDGTIDTAKAGPSDVQGIFRPLLKASKSGKARLRLVLGNPKGQSVHDLGEVTVWATSAEGAKAAPAEAEEEGAVAFSKEVQWRIPFMTTAAQVTNFAETVPVTVDVQIQPQAEAIVSAPVDGILRAARMPAAGDRVRRGQVLASISSTLGGGEDVATLDLAINEARIARDAAAREVARMTQLVEAEAVPARRLDEARTALRMAEAQLRSASQRRSAVAGGGAGVPVVAPISGEVLDSALVQGAGVTGGQRLLRIGDPAALWLVARVPEAMAAMVGTPNGIDLQLPDRVITLGDGTGQLVQRGAAIDPQTRTLSVIYAWNSRALRPGQRVQGLLRTGYATRRLTIPASALLNESGQDVVYVQLGGETFQRRAVTVLARSGTRVAIEGQLKAGERVVTRGAAAVRAAAATPDAFGHGHAH
ncbi:efflux RND transporter periplasmic adaptor subunit [Sphingopyxis alaskensis]|jgi:membrane fusion protein, heavy metal efflux system|uniref:Secretion protein HlyD n=1 Tax=Sphingopyxis alaskensis (strain DSM 13593 / LMG 18877 / RB2256) TaxID=317655 RepID=Q1GS76_SPHAL|nr:efflux RND transporter periplasmic adaptor subunit [Sphingopyxis alaskensis]ABF53496.1 Secretion protein HlyD [Sphingopyxis alaskensis RB2256]MCM3421074.1 efflux RND transporter periplasmic adaptor subunit [Sphingopyxis alaskensis]